MINKVGNWKELEETLLSDSAVETFKEWLNNGKLAAEYPMLYVLSLTPENQIFHKGAVTAWDHTLITLQNAIKMRASLRVRLAILFHDTGKANTFVDNGEGLVTAINHEHISPVIAKVHLSRIKCPKPLIAEVEKIITHHMKPHFMVGDNIDVAKRDALLVEFVGGLEVLKDKTYDYVALYNDLITHAMCDSDRPENYGALII